MHPVILRTERLVLSVPTLADADRTTEYCQDPLFEKYLSTPWPYRREHAEQFLGEVVPTGWRLDRDYTWALRESDDGPLLGVIGLHRRRALEPESRDIGYWIGAPHRGRGLMTEAARAVVRWAFDGADIRTLYWECVPGNAASARTAQAAGFVFTGIGPAQNPHRDGSRPEHWHARLDGPRIHGAAGPVTLPWPAEPAL
jgi:RimJ/RimL family protein N-acetyltransferase